MLDVGALLEDAENRGGMLEHVDDLHENNVKVSDRRKKNLSLCEQIIKKKGLNCDVKAVFSVL